MKATLVRIGNSRGIRLPKPVIEQCGFGDEVEMEVRRHELVIRPSSHARSGWGGAFARMGDELLDQIRTIDKTRLIRKLGTVSKGVQTKILGILQEMFAK